MISPQGLDTPPPGRMSRLLVNLGAWLRQGAHEIPAWVWLLLFFFVIRGFIWALVVPPFQTPDEPTHFSHIYSFYIHGGSAWQTYNRHYDERTKLLRGLTQSGKMQFRPDHRRLFNIESLNGPDEEVITALPKDSEVDTVAYPYLATIQNPQVYYWLGGHLLRLLPTPNPLLQILATRMLGVLFGVISVFFCFLAARELFPGDTAWPALITIFYTFIPEFTYISSSTNINTWAYACGLFFFYGLLRWLCRPGDRSSVFWLAAALLVNIGSQFNNYFFYPLTVWAIMLVVLRDRRIPWRDVGWIMIPCVLVVIFYKTYPGSSEIFINSTDSFYYYRTIVRPVPWEDIKLLYYVRTLFWDNLMDLWGAFGWNETQYPPVIYDIFRRLMYWSMGLLLLAIAIPGKRDFPKLALFVILSFIPIFFMGVYYTNIESLHTLGNMYGLGRHLFPIFFPISVCATVGLRGLFTDKFAQRLAYLLCLFMIIINLYGLIAIVIPRYYA